ncbi:MAG: hypothetical protein ACI4EF_02610 [Coprococcus sp.]
MRYRIVPIGVVRSIVTIALGWEDLLKMINTIPGTEVIHYRQIDI